MTINDTGSHKEITAGQWRAKQVVRVLYANSYTAVYGSFGGMALTAFVLGDVFDSLSLWMWLSCGIILTALRVVTYRRYTKCTEAMPPEAWLLWHRGMTLFSGCLYGALGVFFFADNPLYQALVIFLVGGMASGAVGTYSVDLLTYRLFLFPALIPLMARVLVEGERPHLAMAMLLGMLSLVLMRSAREANRVMMENIDMTHSLQYRATHDSLVGLLNREEFENIFKIQTEGTQVTCALLFIDLDNFKAVNDTLGHQAGDKALQRIGEIIRAAVRAEDTAARMGGDEFMILLSPCTVDQAEIVAAHLLEKIDESQKALPDNHPRLGASIGIGYSINEKVTYQSMLKAADNACYDIKKSGKGHFAKRHVGDV
ncbi:MAG: GGDEF domain-containing protein [Hahellaceae bacterium]|nr:GGDEF domain-containing protein [Hahellaceae bacterium]